MTPNRDEALDGVRAAAAQVEFAEAALGESVLRARAAGHTWQEVGDVLGVSRQAAFKRFGRPVDPETGTALHTGPAIDPAALAERVFRALAAGEHDTVHGLMTHACARRLTRTRIAEVWRDVLASVGELESFSGHETRTHDGAPLPGATTGPLVARVLLHHEAGETVGHVSVHRSGKVDGLLIAPPSAEDDLAF